MPTPKYATIFILIHELDNGAPWKYLEWQDRTHITRGLFPDEDEDLPPGMTRSENDAIKSYWSAFKNQPKEAQYAFASNKLSDHHTGRQLWSNWVSKHMPKWNFSQTVDQVLRNCSVHPSMLMKALGTTSVEVHELSMALAPLCRELFGENRCVVLNGNLMCQADWRPIMMNILTKALERISHCIKRQREVALNAGDEAERVVDGKSLWVHPLLHHL